MNLMRFGILGVAFIAAAAAVLLALTLISAYMHMSKRRKVAGKPIPVAAQGGSEDDD